MINAFEIKSLRSNVSYFGYKSDEFFTFGAYKDGEMLLVYFSLYTEFLKMMGAQSLLFYYFNKGLRAIHEGYFKSIRISKIFMSIIEQENDNG